MADGKELVIPREKDIDEIIQFFYSLYRGENAMKLWFRIRRHYCNISRRKIQLWLNKSREHGELFPVFRNKRKLKPVTANSPMSQVQVDLVDFSSMPCSSDGKTYRYVFAFLDVFSRFIVLLPMVDKTANEAATQLKMVIMQLGLPERIQTDQGSEFKGVQYVASLTWEAQPYLFHFWLANLIFGEV